MPSNTAEGPSAYGAPGALTRMPLDSRTTPAALTRVAKTWDVTEARESDQATRCVPVAASYATEASHWGPVATPTTGSVRPNSGLSSGSSTAG